MFFMQKDPFFHLSAQIIAEKFERKACVRKYFRIWISEVEL